MNIKLDLKKISSLLVSCWPSSWQLLHSFAQRGPWGGWVTPLPRVDPRGDSGLPCPNGIEDSAHNGLEDRSGYLVRTGTEVLRFSETAALETSDEAVR